ncbi:MAG: 3-methyl-2-oxobutanoate hydroxymethyltransferase [Phototrophicales bacterium]|nr:MAG: 3-methyl-2-oxobutanoate hydroxymethyltransferase [Phototrophicales bacterium]
MAPRLTIRDIQKMKQQGDKIAMITAYDATSARLAEAAGAPMLLVGDTLGMVVQGHDTTIPVTLDQMIYHAEIVSRVTTRALIVGDMPFMTYKIDGAQALENAARLMQRGRVSAVKLEGGEAIAPTIARVVEAGIPVMAHIGLLPQSVNEIGGFRVQGTDVATARQLIQDALAVQRAGAFAVVLELVPAPLAELITARLDIPTIGIGAGAGCDGQVQVFHDLLGLFDAFIPKHTRRFADIGAAARTALAEYVAQVGSGEFPKPENSFGMKEEVLKALKVDNDADY